jgi:hypothetical protein
MTHLHGNVVRASTMAIGLSGFGTGREKEIGEHDFPIQGSAQQRHPEWPIAIPIEGVGVCSRVEQRSDDFNVSFLHSSV